MGERTFRHGACSMAAHSSLDVLFGFNEVEPLDVLGLGLIRMDPSALVSVSTVSVVGTLGGM